VLVLAPDASVSSRLPFSVHKRSIIYLLQNSIRIESIAASRGSPCDSTAFLFLSKITLMYKMAKQSSNFAIAHCYLLCLCNVTFRIIDC